MGDPTEVVRGLYRAFAEGDIAGLKAGFHDDAVWHSPGQDSQLKGEYRGIDRVLGFLGQVSELSEGTFAADLHAVSADGEYASAFHTATAHRGDRALVDRNILLLRIANGRVSEVWEHHYDLFAVDEFWS
jgi:ketosteroid isomerase-like protein